MSDHDQPERNPQDPAAAPPLSPQWIAASPPWQSPTETPVSLYPPAPPRLGHGGRGTPPGAGDDAHGPWGAPPGPAAGGPVGTWGTAPMSAWPPPSPASRARRSRASVAGAVIVGIVAAFVGVGIGSQLHLRRSPTTTNTAFAPITPTSPSPGAGQTSPSAGTSPSPATGSNPPAQAGAIAAKTDPSVVDINTVLGFQSGAGAGTGMILSSSGEILTNNHVIDGATSISVTLVATGRTYSAAVVGTDPTQDIAVLQLKGVSGLKPIQIGDSSSVAQGDSVVAIGNAGGVGGTPAAVTGTVQAVNQTITASDQGGANAETLNGLIQTDAPIQPGDSGGPLVNANGQVIGIDTAASSGRRFSAGANAGFAIPIAQAVNIARQIQAGHPSALIHIGLPGFLGVVIVPTNSSQGGFGSGGATSGAVVAGVQPGSPAATAGLVAGDTITTINGQTVDTPEKLSALTKAHRSGDKVTVGWTTQSGASHRATLRLATGPAD